jgi:hypothetical protein
MSQRHFEMRADKSVVACTLHCQLFYETARKGKEKILMHQIIEALGTRYNTTHTSSLSPNSSSSSSSSLSIFISSPSLELNAFLLRSLSTRFVCARCARCAQRCLSRSRRLYSTSPVEGAAEKKRCSSVTAGCFEREYRYALETRRVVGVVVIDLYCARRRDWSFAAAEVEGEGEKDSESGEEV